jgi:glucose-6-phosphate isomerase
LAEAVDLDRWRRALAEGEALNNTEARPALHHAVRAGSDDVQEGPSRPQRLTRARGSRVGSSVCWPRVSETDMRCAMW